MNLRQALALTIKTARKTQKLTQEDFGVVSSRTYMSALERGLKSPTLDKLDDLSNTMEIHPASLVLTAYTLLSGGTDIQRILERVAAESNQLLANSQISVK